MVTALFAAPKSGRDAWEAALKQAASDAELSLDLRFDPGATPPESVDYLLFAPNGPLSDLSPYSNVKAIINLWAGVEEILGNATLPPDVPLLRMVEAGMNQGMTDYVCGHAMRLHLGMDAQRARAARREWVADNPPLSCDRKIGIVGLGALGRDVAEMLSHLGFTVLGWSRSEKRIEGVTCLDGSEGFDRLLAEAEIVVLLAPLTRETENLFDARAFAKMRPGAHLINVARGPLIDDDALLDALETGTLGSATLDVFRTEPLPREHPFWGHGKITITPHIASVTRPKTAAQTVIAEICRGEADKPFLNMVQRTRGY